MNRNITDQDAQAIADVLQQRINDHAFCGQGCQFAAVEPEKLNEAIKFYENFNRIIENSKQTALRTVIQLGVRTVIGLVLVGAAVALYNWTNGGKFTLP